MASPVGSSFITASVMLKNGWTPEPVTSSTHRAASGGRKGVGFQHKHAVKPTPPHVKPGVCALPDIPARGSSDVADYTSSCETKGEEWMKEEAAMSPMLGNGLRSRFQISRVSSSSEHASTRHPILKRLSGPVWTWGKGKAQGPKPKPTVEELCTNLHSTLDAIFQQRLVHLDELLERDYTPDVARKERKLLSLLNDTSSEVRTCQLAIAEALSFRRGIGSGRAPPTIMTPALALAQRAAGSHPQLRHYSMMRVAQLYDQWLSCELLDHLARNPKVQLENLKTELLQQHLIAPAADMAHEATCLPCEGLVCIGVIKTSGHTIATTVATALEDTRHPELIEMAQRLRHKAKKRGVRRGYQLLMVGQSSTSLKAFEEMHDRDHQPFVPAMVAHQFGGMAKLQTFVVGCCGEGDLVMARVAIQALCSGDIACNATATTYAKAVYRTSQLCCEPIDTFREPAHPLVSFNDYPPQLRLACTELGCPTARCLCAFLEYHEELRLATVATWASQAPDDAADHGSTADGGCGSKTSDGECGTSAVAPAWGSPISKNADSPTGLVVSSACTFDDTDNMWVSVHHGEPHIELPSAASPAKDTDPSVVASYGGVFQPQKAVDSAADCADDESTEPATDHGPGGARRHGEAERAIDYLRMAGIELADLQL